LRGFFIATASLPCGEFRLQASPISPGLFWLPGTNVVTTRHKNYRRLSKKLERSFPEDFADPTLMKPLNLLHFIGIGKTFLKGKICRTAAGIKLPGEFLDTGQKQKSSGGTNAARVRLPNQ